MVANNLKKEIYSILCIRLYRKVVNVAIAVGWMLQLKNKKKTIDANSPCISRGINNVVLITITESERNVA